MARIFASSDLNPPIPSPSPPYTPSRRTSLFRLHHLSLHCAGLNFAHASLNTWFCTSCCHFDGCFRFLLVFAIGMLPFLYPTLDPLAFVPNIFQKFTHILWFKFKPWFEQNFDVFASKPSFPQRAVLHKNRVIHKHNVLHKNHVLAGPVQGLFAACRIAAIHGGRLRAGRIIIHASSSAAVEILRARSHHGDIVAHASPRADLDSIHRRSTERKDKRTTEMNDGSEQTQCLFGIYIYMIPVGLRAKPGGSIL